MIFRPAACKTKTFKDKHNNKTYFDCRRYASNLIRFSLVKPTFMEGFTKMGIFIKS